MGVFRQGHSAKSREWETPAENLQSSVAIPSSEIPLFSDLSEFVGSCGELSGVVGIHLAKPFWQWA